MGKTKGEGVSHEQTWGANEHVKAEWQERHGDEARKAAEEENEKRAKEELDNA